MCAKLFISSIRNHTRIQKVLDNVFLVDEGREDPNQLPLKAGHHRPTSEMTFHWRVDGGLTLNAGLIALWFSGDPNQYC